MRSIFVAGIALALAVANAPAWAEAIVVPDGLQDQVDFWKRVYTEVDTDGGLLHDSSNLSVVYEVIDFPDDVRTRRQRQRYVDRFKAEYRQILGQLAKGKRTGLTPAQRRVLGLWPADVSDATLRRARSRLRFQLGQSDKFRAGLIRSGAWEPHIRRTLKAMGLPEELAALPHVESSFNPRARSRVGAAGLWQFTRTTGRRYMRVDHVVDERMDPFLSSVAAARLLEHNHSVLGSWPLAITAYNHGAAGMRRAVRQVGTDDLAVIVDRYRGRTFGFASRNFYAAFLAAVEVDFHSDRYFGDLERDEPVHTTTLKVPDYIPLKALASALEIDVATLREHNPALLDPVWEGNKRVPRGFELRLPRGRAGGNPAVRLASLDDDQRYSRQVPDRFHTVRSGQTLSAIAARYGVRTTELVSLNNLRSRNLIRAGQVLRLPGAEGPKGERLPAKTKDPEPIPESGVYEVRQGDSLWEIARRYDMRVAELTELNGLSANEPLRVGRTLRLRPEAGGEDEESAEVVASADEIADSAPAAALDYAAVLADALPEQAPDEGGDEPGEGGAMPVETQPQLSADPADYSVAANGTIEIQAAETLGHYADWLEIRTQRLRDINGMPFGKPVVVGRRLKLRFTEVDRATFVERRRDYHRRLQNRFFERHRIVGSEPYNVRRGDSLWLLARRAENVPIWLLRQYNPDLDFSTLRPGMEVVLPRVERREVGEGAVDGAPVQRASLDS